MGNFISLFFKSDKRNDNKISRLVISVKNNTDTHYNTNINNIIEDIDNSITI